MATPPGSKKPGYGAQAAFVAAGAQLVPLQVDDQGWRLTSGPTSPRVVIYVTRPASIRWGATMRMDQRLRLIELCGSDGRLRHRRRFRWRVSICRAPGAGHAGADTSDRVIYLGTFAKLLFPALRLGFMVLPESLLPGYPRRSSASPDNSRRYCCRPLSPISSTRDI